MLLLTLKRLPVVFSLKLFKCGGGFCFVGVGFFASHGYWATSFYTLAGAGCAGISQGTGKLFWRIRDQPHRARSIAYAHSDCPYIQALGHLGWKRDEATQLGPGTPFSPCWPLRTGPCRAGAGPQQPPPLPQGPHRRESPHQTPVLKQKPLPRAAGNPQEPGRHRRILGLAQTGRGPPEGAESRGRLPPPLHPEGLPRPGPAGAALTRRG